MSSEEIGTVELSGSSRLVFTVSWWKGRQFAGVRKYVISPKYSGPTKSGLAIGGDILVSLIHGLLQLRAGVSGPAAREFGRMPMNGDTQLVISIVPPDDLASLPSVDIREFVESTNYNGPTKKGIRFAWDKLPEIIAILETQAQQIGAREQAQSILFPEARPSWVSEAQKAASVEKTRDEIVNAVLPAGPKEFPGEFVSTKAITYQLELPAEPLALVQMSDGRHAVQTDFGFKQIVRNRVEGSYIYYAWLRGRREVAVPKEMIEIFKTVKAYERELHNLRHSLLLAYERKSGHRPMAEYQTRQAFTKLGIPWLD